jgi:hypothetical protein
MLARETDQVFLVCMRISHPDFATVRIVNNTEIVERTDGTYLPYPFQLILPADTDDQVPQITVQFDNIDRSITQLIKDLTNPPKVQFEVILAETPDTVEAGPFSFSILNTQFDNSVITGTLGFEEDVLNQQIPKGIYTPSNSPGLFV